MSNNFQPLAILQVHLRSYVQLKADDVGGVLSGLADVNAYDAWMARLRLQTLIWFSVGCFKSKLTHKKGKNSGGNTKTNIKASKRKKKKKNNNKKKKNKKK